jgi:hypothetical protein
MSLEARLSIQTDVDLRDLILNVILTKNGNTEDLVPIPINSNWNNEIIVCDEVDLDVNIFRNNLSLVEAIEKMNVLLVIIGDSIRFPFKPINVKILKNNQNLANNISVLLDKWICINEKRNKRERVLAIKLNRLFYILHELETKDEVFMEDIIKVTGVSKRTVQRDFQMIKEMLIHKDIAYDEFNKSYVLNDLI